MVWSPFILHLQDLDQIPGSSTALELSEPPLAVQPGGLGAIFDALLVPWLSSLAGWNSALLYFDIPDKKVQQFKHEDLRQRRQFRCLLFANIVPKVKSAVSSDWTLQGFRVEWTDCGG